MHRKLKANQMYGEVDVGRDSFETKLQLECEEFQKQAHGALQTLVFRVARQAEEVDVFQFRLR